MSRLYYFLISASYSSLLIASLSIVSFLVLLVYWSLSSGSQFPSGKVENHIMSRPASYLIEAAHRLSISEGQTLPKPPDTLSLHRTAPSPPRILVTQESTREAPPHADKSQHDVPHNLGIAHPLPIWIPLPHPGPSPSSICARKDSAATCWSEESREDGARALGYQPDGSPELLCGIGDQFNAALGRRLSWLVWNDSAFGLRDNAGSRRCSTA